VGSREAGSNLSTEAENKRISSNPLMKRQNALLGVLLGPNNKIMTINQSSSQRYLKSINL
jgi:hypothetical protein